MNIAEQLEQNEKYEEAYIEYKKLLMNKPDDVDILTRIAHLALILENKNEAKYYYAKILEVEPSNIMAHEQLLDLYINEDKFKYYLLRGNMHALQQQLSFANSDYKKAILNAKDQDEALPARYLRAGLCEGQEKYQEAIDEYLRIADFDDKNPEVFIKLAELYEKTEGIISSIQILERGRIDNGFTEYNEILAGYYIRNSQPAKALAITKNELTRARALFDLGENEKGFQILTENKKQYEKNQVFYSLLAQYYYQKDMYNDAFEAINKYEHLAPNSPLIYQMRALIYEKQKDAFNEHLNWGKYNILRGNKDIALNEYMTAYRFNSNDADLIETIAVLWENEKDKTKAAEFYERLVDIEPRNIQALQKLSEFRESIGDKQGALSYLEQLKAIDANNQYVLDNYSKLQNNDSSIDILSIIRKFFGTKM